MGYISHEDALAQSMVGPFARASNVNYDARMLGNGGYGFLSDFQPILDGQGDCYARVKVRALEVLQSIDIIEEMIAKIPAGDIAVDVKGSPAAGAEAANVVEQPRGECYYYARGNGSKFLDRMRMRIDARVGNEIRLVEGYANRPSLTQPLTMLEPYQRFIDDARRRMDIGLTRIVDDASLTVEKLHASLTALSPQSTLDRGYAVVQNADGHVIDDAGKVSAGDHLTLTLRKGVITATAQ